MLSGYKTKLKMSSDSALEIEDLEIIQFVRMDDIQPRNPGETVQSDSENSSEMLETCIVDDGDFEDDDDSNVGSIVSINSDEVQDEVLIVPEVLESDQDIEEPESTEDSEAQDLQETQDPDEVSESQSVPTQVMETVKATEEVSIPKPPPMSWPTLEILPGGVINQLTDKGKVAESKAKKQMMYACAKCSQSFRHLFCLVKHVKWHEDQDKKRKLGCSKLTPIKRKMEDLKQRSRDIDESLMKQQIEKAPTADAAKSMNKIHTHTLKKRCKKIPKKS